MTPSMTLLVIGSNGGVCSQFGFLLETGIQGSLLGRQHKGGAAGDGGIDEVQQSVRLITPLEGQTGCHVGTEGQQPAIYGRGLLLKGECDRTARLYGGIVWGGGGGQASRKLCQHVRS